MPRLRPVLIVSGAVLALVGLLWIGQGLGYVRWPAASTMIHQRGWADRGAGVAIFGLLLVIAGRRMRR